MDKNSGEGHLQRCFLMYQEWGGEYLWPRSQVNRPVKNSGVEGNYVWCLPYYWDLGEERGGAIKVIIWEWQATKGRTIFFVGSWPL